jgi:hypothetical protein
MSKGKTPTKFFLRYLRRRDRRPFGLVVGWRANNGDLEVGYSKCRKGDLFDKKEGLLQAFRHCMLAETADYTAGLPYGVGEVISEVIDRMGRYYDPTKRTKATKSPKKRRSRKQES